MKCWRLIIRHMRTTKHRTLRSEWSELAPQVKRGDHSPSVLELLAEILRPKLKVSKRLSFYDIGDKLPVHPSDLLKIDYEVKDHLSADDVLQAWPEDTSLETDDRLLSLLTIVLKAALADAIHVGVEENEGYGISDIDVPSVAQSGQNSYRTGFNAIVRVMAELWSRLAKKSPKHALAFIQTWCDGGFGLTRRLALLACADPIISPAFAADILGNVPSSELFLPNSSVEVYRLIRARWKEFPTQKQGAIMRLLCEGPPRNSFREGAEIDRAIDRCRFEILTNMVRDGFDIGDDASTLMKDICTRWPEWTPRPAEQAGFHIWHKSGWGATGDPDKLRGVPDNRIVAESKKIAEETDFSDGNTWDALCLSDPDRAARGLEAAAAEDDWTAELWCQLLWTQKEYSDPDTAKRIALLLSRWPHESFEAIIDPAASWLEEHSKTLDDELLWPLWDRIADAALIVEAVNG